MMMHEAVVVILQFFLMMTVVSSRSNFTNPNVTLTCIGNTINVKWNPVHEHYKSVDEIIKKGLLQDCFAKIKCDSGYWMEDTHLGCDISSFNPILEKNYQLNYKEDRCSVLIGYVDYRDYEGNEITKKEYCDFIDPSPSSSSEVFPTKSATVAFTTTITKESSTKYSSKSATSSPVVSSISTEATSTPTLNGPNTVVEEQSQIATAAMFLTITIFLPFIIVICIAIFLYKVKHVKANSASDAVKMYDVGKDYYSDIGREEQSICEDCDKYNGTLQYSQFYDHLLNYNKDYLRSTSSSTICSVELILKELNADPSNITNFELTSNSAMDLASSSVIEQNRTHEFDALSADTCISMDSPSGGYMEEDIKLRTTNADIPPGIVIKEKECLIGEYVDQDIALSKNIDAVDDSSGTQDIALDENIGTRNADIGYIGSYVEETVAVIDDEISSNITIEANQSDCN